MEFIYNFFFTNLIKIYNKVIMSDNAFTRKVIEDVDKLVATRKPIEVIRDDIAELKADMIHIKNYIRKLEIREELKEEEENKKDSEYETGESNNNG